MRKLIFASEEDRRRHLAALAAARNARWYAKLTPERRHAMKMRSKQLRHARFDAMSPEQREAARIKHNAMQRDMRAKHPERHKAHGRKNYVKHKAARSAASKKYYESNKSRINALNREYVQRNKDRVRAYQAQWRSRRRIIDQSFRVFGVLKTRMHRLLRGAVKKSASAEAMIGCSRQDLIKYIESKWLIGMNWGNWGLASRSRKTWHIDHIRPCASFDLSIPAHQMECFHFTNLQPLWAEDNIRKSDSCPESI